MSSVTTSRPSNPRIISRDALQDSLFLAAVTGCSFIVYIGQLGLYSDDWAFLSLFRSVADPTFPALFAAMHEELSTRPMQALELAALYRAFGLEPLGYHLVNSAVFAGAVVMFYAALRELRLPRLAALTIPLVFSLLPHYSTDRLWIAAFQANLSIAFYFVSLSATLRVLRARPAHAWGWMLASTLALLASVLSYEVVAPLFALNAGVMLWLAWRNESEQPRKRWTLSIATAAIHAVALLSAVAYKLGTTDRAGDLGGLSTYIWNVKRVARGAISTNFGSYGVLMPEKIVRIMMDYPDLVIFGLAAMIGLAVFIYLHHTYARTGAPGALTSRQWAVMGGVGFVTFGLGYAISLITFDIGFSPAGINNRTAIAAAVGVAIAYVAAIGFLSSLLRSERARRLTYCLLTSLLCTGGFIIINTIATFWVEADRQQRAVIASLSEQEIPRRATVLLDGVCPYIGPGIIFETHWDVSGMLQIEIDPSLNGDVIKPTTQVLDEGVRTILYDDVINVYPFDELLLVYHAGQERMYRLASQDDARRYFEVDRRADLADCPAGIEGRGTPIF